MGRGFVNMVVFIAIVAVAMLHGSEALTTHVVGDALGWVVPPGGPVAYTTWAAMKSFSVGDTLVFNFTTGMHTVAEVTKAAFDSCNVTNPISISTNGPTNISLNSSGEHYYICTFPSHCDIGQKLAINVSASSNSPAPQPATPGAPAATPSALPGLSPSPSAVVAPTPAPSRGSQIYTVGDSLGWTVPPGGQIAYQTWASNKNFRVGDSLVFNFANGRHNVAEVTKEAYDSCNTSSPLTTSTNAPARIALSRAGEHYYLCTFQGHCSLGQKLAVTVAGPTATSPSASASGPSPSSVATPPDTAFGPTGTTNPATPSPTSSPGNSAPFVAAAALPVTFLSIALALFY